MEEKLQFAVFIDFDNIEIGVKTTLGREFDVSVVLEALKERGEVVTKIAYGNWRMAGHHTQKMAEHAVQMVQRDPSPRGDKNGADINLALDALEMAFTRDFINAFAIVGGDSDFIALVERLKQYNKAVYVVGGRGFTSTILQKNCKEFIAYENLIQAALPPRRARRAGAPGPREDVLPLSNAMPLLSRALKVLSDREHEPLLGLVKSTMMQLDPTFTERDYGFSSFLDFAQRLSSLGLVRLDRSNGNYRVGLADHQPAAETAQPASREEAALAVLRQVLEDAARQGRKDFHLHGLKQFVMKMRPGFDERKYGFRQFSALLNLAQDRGLVSLVPDEKGAIRVRAIERPVEPPPEAAETPEPAETGPEAYEPALPDSPPPVEGEPYTAPLFAEAMSGSEEPMPAEEPALPRRRRPSSGAARRRAPRKKKTE